MIRLAEIVIAAIGITVVLMGFFAIGPYVETWAYPVYSKFEIIEMRETGDGQTQVRFKFTKKRICDPMGFSWYIGDPGAAFRQLKVVPVDPKADTPIRPLGTQISQPYFMDATPQQLRQGAFAEIFNRCHLLWLTRSVIYP